VQQGLVPPARTSPAGRSETSVPEATLPLLLFPPFSPKNHRIATFGCVATAPNGLPTSGKTGVGIGGCDYPWGGVEEHANSYSVLVDSSLALVESTGGPKLTVNPVAAGMTGSTSTYSLGLTEGYWDVFDARINSGIENNGSYLSFCSVYYLDGYHPGKLSWEFGGCNLSFGGVEIHSDDPHIELIVNWQDNGGADFLDGNVPIDVPTAYKPAMRALETWGET
jgi:hypothetical protein